MMKLNLRTSLLAIAGATLMLGAGGAQAVSDADYAVVQKLADQYLSSLPDSNWYEFTPEEVAKMIKDGKTDFQIIDVRVPKDKKFDVGHIPGAIFIGSPTMAKPENLAKLPKDKKIIVHCDTGQQQNKVLTVLRLLGYDAYAMKWGYMGWTPAPPTGAALDAISGSMTKGYPVQK
jgi:rhodanese-related sulfurtransferase